jgi:hypothetical protein
MGPLDSVIGIVTRYELGTGGFEPHCGNIFPHTGQTGRGPQPASITMGTEALLWG